MTVQSPKGGQRFSNCAQYIPMTSTNQQIRCWKEAEEMHS